MNGLDCHICGWSGTEAELTHPPTGEEYYYCPNCATSIDVE